MTDNATVIAVGIAMDVARDREWLAQRAPKPAPRRRYLTPATFSDDDVLRSLLPAIYVEALTGVETRERGPMCCPLPDHDDGNPSFYVYADAAAGWYCYGCNRGGSVYDFAAALWGLSTRGGDFNELRRRLAVELLRRAA